MLLLCLRVDEYVVKIDDDPLVDGWIKDLEHHVGERCRGISQPKRDNVKFKVTITASERRRVSVGFVYALLMVAGEQVEFGEEFCSTEAVDELVNAGEWVSIFACDPVESTVVNTHAQGTILLFYEKDGCAIGGGAG